MTVLDSLHSEFDLFSTTLGYSLSIMNDQGELQLYC